MREVTVVETKERILVIDPDVNERDALVEGALLPFGYIVEVAGEGGEGLSALLANTPDVLILALNTPGLSAGDILAAINAQALDLPVVVVADTGREKDALHAFRLGARDYVVRPLRDAEVIQVVERVLKEVRIRRDRETLVGEVRHAEGEAEARLREMRTMISIGKAVTASRNLDEVFDRVIRAAVQLTRVETVGVYLRDPETNQLILRAGQNLSRDLAGKVGQPVEDGLAPIVMNSREVYSASGEGLKQFRPAQEGAATVIYAPLVVQDNAVGLLWVANARSQFEPQTKEIVGALADYAAIAVVNAHLFSTMQNRTRQLEEINQQLQGQTVLSMSAAGTGGDAPALDVETLTNLRSGLTHLMGSMNLFRTGEMGRLPAGQQAAVDVMHRELDQLVQIVDQSLPQDAA
jgi:DNA-binding response OmpR family regulator